MKKIFFLFTLMISMMALTSCSSDDDDSVTLSDKMMYAGDSVKLGTDVSVENQFVAYVSDDGYLHAFHVGETTYSQGGSTAKIVVRGHYNALNVITDWGMTVSELKSKVNGTPDKDTEVNGQRIIAYDDMGLANGLAYIFKDNKLISTWVYSNPNDETEILNWLAERYLFMPEEVSAYTYAGMDGLDEEHCKTVVFVTLDTEYDYDYMLQTMFFSKEYVSSLSNAKKMLPKLAPTRSIALQK